MTSMTIGVSQNKEISGGRMEGEKKLHLLFAEEEQGKSLVI